MCRNIVLIFAVLCVTPGFVLAVESIPKEWPKERYQQISLRSPFALATPVSTADPTASFAANLYITGLAKIDAQDFVYISTRDQQTRYTLASGIAGPEDMSLVRIEWNPQVGKSKVTISKGGETGVLEFDQAVIQSAPEGQPMVPPPVVQGKAPQPPQPPQAQAQRVRPGMTAPEPPRTGEGRRRIRIIPNRPR